MTQNISKKLKRTSIPKDDTYSTSYNKYLVDITQILNSFTITNTTKEKEDEEEELDNDISYQIGQLINLSKQLNNIEPKKKRAIPRINQSFSNIKGKDIYNTCMNYNTQTETLYSDKTRDTKYSNNSQVFSTFLVRPTISINHSMTRETLVNKDTPSLLSPSDSESLYSLPSPFSPVLASKKSFELSNNYPPRKVSLPTSKDMNLFNFKNEFFLFNRKGSAPSKMPTTTLAKVQDGAELFGWMQVYRNANSILPLKQWKKRYIVFKEITLYRFESSSSDANCSETLQLNCQSIVCVSTEFPDQKFVLQIDNPGREKFYLKAETANQLTSWLHALKTAVVKSSYLMRGLPAAPSNHVPLLSNHRGFKSFSKLYSKHNPVPTSNYALNC